MSPVGESNAAWMSHPPGRRSGAAAVALAAVAVVLQTVGGDAGAVRRQDAPHFLQALAQLHLAGRELVGTLEQAVRQVRQVFLHTGDAKVEIDLVVVGL